MDRERVFAAATDERHGIASLIDDLDEAQLATPSLCAGWDIKTVAAHLVSTLTDGVGGFIYLALRRGSLRRAIDKLAQRWAQLPTTEVVASLRQYADRPVSPPVFGPLDRSPTFWCTVATSGFRLVCPSSPTRSGQRLRWIS